MTTNIIKATNTIPNFTPHLNYFTASPDESGAKFWSLLTIEVLLKLSEISSNGPDLTDNANHIWEKTAEQIGLNNPELCDYETFKEKIKILSEEAKLFNIKFTYTPFEMIQNLKELNDKVCKINHDIFKLWAAIYQQAPAKPGFTINKPDNIWLYNLHEIIEAFDSWITQNKDKIIDNFELDLSKLNLSYLSDLLVRFDNLTDLNLSSNKLTNLPNTIGKLTKLNNLNLCYNQLQELPDSIGNLTNLNELNLNHNYLKQLPNTFDKLINLKFLNLSYNNLTKLPDNFKNLTNLTQFFKTGNPIENTIENPLGEFSKKRKRSDGAND